MYELFEAALSLPNIVYTTLLLLVILYWVSVILGALDISSFDLDADIDIDADLDVEGGSAGSIVAGMLHFFNFGRMPVTIILSFIILFVWMGSILGNYHFGDGSILFPLAILFPNLFVSLCLTKIITTPLVPLFENMDGGEEALDYIGLDCEIVLPATAEKTGQAKVIFKNTPLLINIKLENDSGLKFTKGDEAVIVRKENGYYLIDKNQH